MLCLNNAFILDNFYSFTFYFAPDFHPYYVYVFMQGSSNSILLVNWKYLPFYFISLPTSNTFFSPCFLFLSDARNQFFFLFYPLPPNTFYSRAHTYPQLFTLQNWSVIIPENQVLNCPFLLITQTYTQTCIDPHTKHIHTENLTQKKSNRSLKSPTLLSSISLLLYLSFTPELNFLSSKNGGRLAPNCV